MRWLSLFFVALLLAATPLPSEPNSAASGHDALADRYWQHWLERDNFLRAQLGQPVETIRPLTYANADADAAFAQNVLDGLHAIDATKLDHDRWLTYRTLTYMAT